MMMEESPPGSPTDSRHFFGGLGVPSFTIFEERGVIIFQKEAPF